MTTAVDRDTEILTLQLGKLRYLQRSAEIRFENVTEAGDDAGAVQFGEAADEYRVQAEAMELALKRRKPSRSRARKYDHMALLKDEEPALYAEMLREAKALDAQRRAVSKRIAVMVKRASNRGAQRGRAK